MHELMAISDVLHPQAQGADHLRGIGDGKTVVHSRKSYSRPGSRQQHDFLLERGAAGKANRVEDLPFRLDQLLGTKKLAEMARAAKTLGRPAAAADICRAVMARLNARPSA